MGRGIDFRQIANKDFQDKFGEDYVELIREELRNSGKAASGNLINTLTYRFEEVAEELQLIIETENYFRFVDQGVSGTQQKYNTPFSYTTKMPPISAIEGWMSIKGIQARDRASGRFIPRKTGAFLIAKSIFKFGLPPMNILNRVNERVRKAPFPQLDILVKNVEQEIVKVIINEDEENQRRIR